MWFVMPAGQHRSYYAHDLHFITCSCCRQHRSHPCATNAQEWGTRISVASAKIKGWATRPGNGSRSCRARDANEIVVEVGAELSVRWVVTVDNVVAQQCAVGTPLRRAGDYRGRGAYRGGIAGHASGIRIVGEILRVSRAEGDG